MRFEDFLCQIQAGITLFERIDLSDENILGLFDGITLRQSILDRTKLIQVSANFSNLESNSIVDAEIQEAFFRESIMTSIDFTGSLLMEVYMNSSNLQRAKFNSAKIAQSYFIGADLRDASFKNCILGGVDFSQSNLQGVDFSDAELIKCKFTDSSQEQITSTNIKLSENIDLFFA